MLYGDEHVRRYEETDGAEGHIWVNDAPVLILTTTGRKTGKDRKFALIYGEDDGKYVIVASKGGAETHPGWYRNLEQEPRVRVQVGAEKFTAHARTADDDERERLWPTMTAIWPDYDKYQASTQRKIPVVVLEPAKQS